ncbi:MAG: EAL domain-containing protein [Butyrivibrio sp.]|nr:EAL domain-containing protein [Butyrivibrio sp.]
MNKKFDFHRLRHIYVGLSVLCLCLAIVFLRRFVHQEAATSYEIPADYVEEVNHRVLLFCSYNPQYYTYSEQIDGFNDGLCANGIEYDVIFMDGKNYNTEKDHEDFFKFFKARMSAGKKYDGIIIVDDDALEFTCNNREELFGDLPIVFIGANDLSIAKKAVNMKGITGFYENDYLKDTLNLAFELLPNNKEIYGLYDNSVAGKSDAERFSSMQYRYPEYNFHPVDVSELKDSELIKVIESIPDDGIIIYMTCFIDAEGRNHSIYEMTSFLSKYSDAPIMRCYESGVGNGVLGAVGMQFYEQAKQAGETMASVLNGEEEIDSIRISLETPSVTVFDYNLMEKYNIDERLLPEDAIIYNKPISFWEKYGDVMPTACFIFASLIFFLLNLNEVVIEGKRINSELMESRDELERSHERLKYLAEHDDFLDILNRRSAVNYLRDITTPDSVYSILMVDIDNFKDINETYGHQVADEILKYLSLELEKLSDDNGWMLARYGGDEFLVMAKAERVTEDSPTIEHIMNIFRTPISIGDETIAMSCSMGISVSDGMTLPDQHIINAEIAMYEAKLRGRNKAFLYSNELKKKVRDENKIKAKILDAIDNNKFFMVYQPQIDTQTCKVIGYEALVRMEEGISPGVFIPIAEASGWVARIGRITTELVISQLSEWKKQGHTLHPISINFSSNQLNDTGYVDFLKETLEKYDVSSNLVEIEVTESLFLERTDKAKKLFDRLKEMNIRILMDDFGTGYSSLGYLTYIPVDVIKLDKSLVDAYLVDGKDRFIKDVILLAHDLDKMIIIEGVEEKWQYERLKEFKADIIQGYYFSKPLKPEEAIVFDVKASD